MDFVDSTALGVLIEARAKLENRQAFLLAAPGLETHRALTISGLDQHLVRARHGRVGARGPRWRRGVEACVARVRLGDGRSSASGSLARRCSGARRAGRGRAANGLPAYIDGYLKWQKLNAKPIRGGSAAHHGNEERLREQAEVGLAATRTARSS